nr:MAG TPA: hypothetical protein [Bacteriophage sp.]
MNKSAGALLFTHRRSACGQLRRGKRIWGSCGIPPSHCCNRTSRAHLRIVLVRLWDRSDWKGAFPRRFTSCLCNTLYYDL